MVDFNLLIKDHKAKLINKATKPSRNVGIYPKTESKMQQVTESFKKITDSDIPYFGNFNPRVKRDK